MMNRHARIEVLLAVYRDLASDEKARVDKHIESCPACRMQLRDYNEVERKLTTLHDIRLSPRLAQSLPDMLEEKQRARPKWSPHQEFIFRGSLGAAGMVLLLVLFLSIAFWSISSDKTSITATPTLTSTMTPIVAPTPQAAEAADTGGRVPKFADPVKEAHPHDVPAPAPVPLPLGTQEAFLLVAIDAHATMIP